MKPLVSVVIIGRNEGTRLVNCLDSVANIHRPDFSLEVIYVDSGSTDSSVSVAAARGARTIALHPDRPTAALGRNAGWRAAAGTYVLFLDGDTILHPDFVVQSLPSFADPSVAVVWGHRRETLATPSIYNRVLDLDWIYPPGPAPFCGGDALMRRSFLEATNGYDDTLIAGEEPELCRRITAVGGRILHLNLPMTGHDLAITRFHQYWRRATRAGHAYAEVSARFAHSEDPFWRAESRRNVVRALLLMGVPSLAVLGSALLDSVLPILAALTAFWGLWARTAVKARWKTQNFPLLLLYGLHSHFQQIPIFLGQLRFWINRRRGLHAGLVEYKQP
jgi:glycosyltransferase involved in cell wall biosynthesis